MQFLFIMTNLYPFWAVPLAIVLIDLGRHMKRKRHKSWLILVGTAGFLVFSSLLWFVFRGDMNSGQWARWIAGQG